MIDEGASAKVRDRAWFFLGKIRYHKQLFAEAEVALNRVGDALGKTLLAVIAKDANHLSRIDTINPLGRTHTLRGIQIILDRDLTELYDVETRALKQAVNRNKKRFPSDFRFILTEKEVDLLVSQSVIPSKKHLGKKWFAFSKMDTEAVRMIARLELGQRK